MNTRTSARPTSSHSRVALILAGIWLLGAILLTFGVTTFLQGSFPIFTFGMLCILLFDLLRTGDLQRIGLRRVPLKIVAYYTLICLMGSLLLMALFEPWSHTYAILVSKASASPRPDTTFGWLVRYPSGAGWLGFTFYAGLVTLFAEELFFRGWVLNGLKRRMSEARAIFWQAILFTLPQLLAAMVLPPVQGILYAGVYSWLAIGLLNGWAASHTRSIWPGLVSATLYNLLMTGLIW